MRRLLIAIAAAVPAMAPAQEAPPEGCFCLAEAGTALPQVQRRDPLGHGSHTLANGNAAQEAGA